jgi:addiction module HigA family antidote
MATLKTWRLWTITERGKIVAKTFAVYPGELLTEFMQPYGLTAYRLAKELSVSLPRVNDIVRGKRSISADTALRLGIHLRLPAQFWLNLQNDYDLRLAAKPGLLAKIIVAYPSCVSEPHSEKVGHRLRRPLQYGFRFCCRLSADY